MVGRAGLACQRVIVGYPKDLRPLRLPWFRPCRSVRAAFEWRQDDGHAIVVAQPHAVGAGRERAGLRKARPRDAEPRAGPEVHRLEDAMTRVDVDDALICGSRRALCAHLQQQGCEVAITSWR